MTSVGDAVHSTDKENRIVADLPCRECNGDTKAPIPKD